MLFKSLVTGIILLFVILSFIPNIEANHLVRENFENLNNDTESSDKKTSEMGMDIAIIGIIPYLEETEDTIFGELHITPIIKNVGDVPVKGVKYFGNSTFYFRNKKYGSAWGGLLLGGLNPGDEWIPQSGAGLWFVNFYPGIFNIEYEIFPTDSNPDNNKIKQVYLVRGGGIIPFWRRLPLLE
jgi:hypothetical protein